jgi:hypothetical protein
MSVSRGAVAVLDRGVPVSNGKDVVALFNSSGQFAGDGGLDI